MDLSAATLAPDSPSACLAPAPAGGEAARSAAQSAVARQVAMLEALSELCMQVAQAAGRQVLTGAAAAAEAAALPPAYVAPEPVLSSVEGHPAVATPATPAPSADPILAFTRAARAVRLSVALWSQLVREQQGQDQAAVQRAAEARAAAAAARQARAARVVERVAHDHFEAALPGEDNDGQAVLAARRAVREARERLEDEDLYGDLLDAPFSEIVARICADVGLSPDWPALAQEQWAQRELAGAGQMGEGETGAGEAAAPPVGSPLAALAAAGPRAGPGLRRAPPEPRPPRSLSSRWRRLRDDDSETPVEAPTLRVRFVSPPDPVSPAPPAPSADPWA